MAGLLLALPLVLVTDGINPYAPLPGWSYALEAAGRLPWPSCPDRYVSDGNNTGCGSGSDIVLGDTMAAWELIAAPEHGLANETFYVKLACGMFLSYGGACNATQINSRPTAGISQAFRFTAIGSGSDGTNFGWALQAVGRQACPSRFASFPASCGRGGKLIMAPAPSMFRLQVLGAHTPAVKTPNSKGGCADPFAWRSRLGTTFMICTGGGLDAYGIANAGPISASAMFGGIGEALGGRAPAWAASGNRWAPENLEIQVGSHWRNFIFVADDSRRDTHRIGWVRSDQDTVGALPSSWSSYSPTSFDLGHTAQGEIDAHVFRDDDGKAYLLWKTDDNSIGMKFTRLWVQEMAVNATAATLVGEKKMVLDSTGMAWVTSWVDGGTLIEGPEVIKHRGFYYLFFAGGKYCQDSYGEGVARSSSLMGPYTKMQSPLLATSLVGSGIGGQKIVGPGHASFVQDADDPYLYYAVYAASFGENCNRLAFVEKMRFNAATGWPYIEFEAHAAALDTPGVGNRVELARPRPRSRPGGTASAGGAVRFRRVVAPCSALAVVELSRWTIPTVVTCANATEPCYGLVADGSGALCIL